MDDERLTVSRSRRRDPQSDRDNGAARAAPRGQDDQQALGSLRDQIKAVVLPSPPADPNWHYIWLSTTNSTDSIHARMRLGYQPVRPEDLPEGWNDSLNLKTGDWSGYIGVNEMILCRIPQARYQQLMGALHHDMPAEEDERLAANVRGLADELERATQRQVQVGAGYEGGGYQRRPTFKD